MDLSTAADSKVVLSRPRKGVNGLLLKPIFLIETIFSIWLPAEINDRAVMHSDWTVQRDYSPGTLRARENYGQMGTTNGDRPALNAVVRGDLDKADVAVFIRRFTHPL